MFRDIDLSLCYPYLFEQWQVQNDETDNLTNFIYEKKTLTEVLSTAKTKQLDGKLQAYAVHRWYNFVCSKATEECVWEYGGLPYLNEKDSKADFFIGDIPFDIKLTVKPKNESFDELNTREGKNKLIKWLLDNQSQEKRKQNSNKIYVVVDSLWAKKDFAKIEEKVKTFMEYHKNHEFNKITYDGNTFFADLIYCP